MDLLKALARLLPEDPNNSAGYGPFRLPSPECDWMQSIFSMHDRYYEIGPDAGMRLSNIDWRIFRALCIAAELPDDPLERCKRARQICRYWPIMRIAGRYLYGRHANSEA